MRGRITGRIVAATLLLLLCLGAAGWLGAWQLSAWQAHREAEARDLSGQDPRPLTDVMGADDPFPGHDVGRPAEISGTWLPDATVLIDGRRREGRRGYWVVTPLTIGSAEAAAVPVVRGWSATAPADPAAEAPRGTATVVGYLQPPEGTGAVDEDPTDAVYPQLRIADLAQRVDVDLYSAYLVLDADRSPADGAASLGDLEAAEVTQLPEVGSFTAIRNFFYALEWWFFGAFAAFIWWRFLRDEWEQQATVASVGSEA